MRRSRTWQPAVALAALLVAAAPAVPAARAADPAREAAAGPACPGPPLDPVVSVQIRLPTVSHNLSLEGEAIARRAVEVEPHIDHDHDWVDGTVGLTTVNFLSDLRLGLVFRDVEQGVCVQIRRVNAVFGFSQMVVYVAREYGTASCAYKEVLNHEHKHVQIFRDEVLKARRPFEDAIGYTIRTKTPFLAPDRAAGEAAARLILESGVQPVLGNMWHQGDNKHRLLDSTESYRRTERQCADW